MHRLLLLPAAFAATLPALSALAPAARAERPLHRFLSVAIAPDGQHIASIEADELPVDGQPPTTLAIRNLEGHAAMVALPCAAAGTCLPSSPTWDHAGDTLAFLLERADGTTAIETVAASGGTPRTLLAFAGPLDALRYGPADRLAVLATAGAHKKVGATAAAAPMEGDIGTGVDTQRIATVTAEGLRFASPDGLYVYEYDWRPDGGFVGTAAPGDGDRNWWVAGLYGFRDGRATRLFQPGPRMQLADPVVAPDGRHVAFVGGWMSDAGSTGGDAFLLPLDGATDARPVDLTGGQPATVTDLEWGCGTGLAAVELAGGETRIAALGDGAAPEGGRVLRRDRRALSAGGWNMSLSCRGGHVATIAQDWNAAPEIVAGGIGTLAPVTEANAGQRSGVAAREIGWAAGPWPAQGWLLEPAGAGPGKRPLVVVVHGGPEAAVTPEFLRPASEERAFLARGWDVFAPNYRGSFGEGEAFAQGSIGDLGGGDWRDVLAGLDAAERAARIDDTRVAIAGWSYGGYMAMWAVTQTHRFRAAAAGAGVSDWLSIEGEAPQAGSDEVNFGGSVYDDAAPYLRASPITHMRGTRTPTLILVGERDVECPLPQSEEFHTALLALGVPTSFHVYAGEGHGFRRAADQADRVRREVAWFARWFGAGTAVPAR